MPEPINNGDIAISSRGTPLRKDAGIISFDPNAMMRLAGVGTIAAIQVATGVTPILEFDLGEYTTNVTYQKSADLRGGETIWVEATPVNEVVTGTNRVVTFADETAPQMFYRAVIDRDVISSDIILQQSGIVTSTNNDFPISVPTSTQCFFDGEYYWLFYCEGTTFKSISSPDLQTWSSQFTNLAGDGDIPSINNGGRAFATAFGYYQNRPVAYALLNRSDTFSGDAFYVCRWDLSNGELINAIDFKETVSARPESHSFLTPIYSEGQLVSLIGGVQGFQEPNSSIAVRSINLDLSGTIGMGGGDRSFVQYAEDIRAYLLEDCNWMLFGHDQGSFNGGSGFGNPNAGTASEMFLKNLGQQTFSEERDVSANFQRSNYSRNESHVGQTNSNQLDNGVIISAYIDDTDSTDGDFGKIRLTRRDAKKSSEWELVTESLIAGDGEAYGLTMTTDGQAVYICYIEKLQAGGRSGKLKVILYNDDSGKIRSPFTIADVTGDIERVSASYRCYGDKLVFAYSERNGTQLETKMVSIDAVGGLSEISFTKGKPIITPENAIWTVNAADISTISPFGPGTSGPDTLELATLSYENTSSYTKRIRLGCQVIFLSERSQAGAPSLSSPSTFNGLMDWSGRINTDVNQIHGSTDQVVRRTVNYSAVNATNGSAADNYSVRIIETISTEVIVPPGQTVNATVEGLIFFQQNSQGSSIPVMRQARDAWAYVY